MPAIINSAALNVAWLIIWKMAAATARGESPIGIQLNQDG
jgi:hypothetical protein